MKRRALAVLAVLAFAAAAAPAAHAADPDRGLVNALDRVGGTLLGPAAFDAVLFDPQPDPPRVRLYLSTEQAHPVEVVLTGPGGEGDAQSARAFFRMTVGGPEGIRLEFDPSPGEIIPCILPPADLRTLEGAPADASRAANFRQGLVTAFGEVGKSIFGDGFAAVAFDPQPDPPQAARLRLFLSRVNPLEIVVVSPSAEGRPVLHMVLGGPEVTLQGNPDLGGWRWETRIVETDLGALVAPDPAR